MHKWIGIASILIAIQAVINQAFPITLKFVVDELTQEVSEKSGDYNRLIIYFGLILAITLTGELLNSISQRLGDFISSRLGRFLTEKYYRKVFTLPQKHFDGETSGKMINQLSRGIMSIQDFVGTSTNFILPAILQAIFGIAVLWYFDRTVALLAFAVFPVYIGISAYSTKRWGKIQKEKNIHEDTARGRIQEAIANIKLVKTYNTQSREWSFVSHEYSTINNLYDRQSTEYHVLNFLRGTGLNVAFLLILYIVFRNTFLGVLSLGEMVLIIQLMNQLRWPLYGMSYILEQIQRAEADSKAFFEVLNLKETEPFRASSPTRLTRNPEIVFDNVSFSYDGDKSSVILKDITLKFDKNETVALVGHSGAGKTTLINLILKLYLPTDGDIFLSGKNYKKTDHSWIRNHIALVFQDNELFSSTIRENVAYGKKGATEKEIISALKKANALEFVSKFEEGLDAQIGERGVKLSGGQKQRIQIARAILLDKPILILDEATSSLDSKSEKLVQEALDTLMKNRLVIIIAHRFSTIQNVDRIVVLDQGTIVDSGAPGKLARKAGVYSELLQYQIEGNKKLLSKYELHS